MANQQQVMAAKNLFAAIILNNPQGVALNLAQFGIQVPPNGITPASVQNACVQLCPTGMPPVQVAQFMASVLNVQVQPNAPYSFELLQLQAQNGGKSLGQLSNDLFYTALTSDTPAASQAMATAAIGANNTALDGRSRKVAQWAVCILALIGFFTVMYVMAKATKKIIS